MSSQECSAQGKENSSPDPLPQEDIRKLHAEINQLLNQQFLITTAAITIFGTFTIIMLPKDGNTITQLYKQHDQLLFVEASVLLLVLGSLFAWSRTLSHLVRIISNYLVATKSSIWEMDFNTFLRGEKTVHTGYIQRMVFLALGTFAVTWPFLISYYLDLQIDYPREFPFLILFLIYLLFVVMFGLYIFKEDDPADVKRWERIARERMAAKHPPPDSQAA